MAAGDVVLKMCNTALDGHHCTGPGVSGPAMSNRLSLDVVIMISEEEAEKSAICAGVRVSKGGWKMCPYDIELDALNPEGSGYGFSPALKLLSWTQEEEEVNYDHVCGGLQLLIVEGRGHTGHPAQDLYWYWFHPIGMRVLMGVAAEL